MLHGLETLGHCCCCFHHSNDRAINSTAGHKWIRGALFLLLILALADVRLKQQSSGFDIVLVLDQSASMGESGSSRNEELVRLIGNSLGKDDRMAVISFAESIEVHQGLQSQPEVSSFSPPTNNDSSLPLPAVEVALKMIPEGRNGRILLSTDGEWSTELQSFANKAARRNVEIHVRHIPRSRSNDLSVPTMKLPEQSVLGEPIQISAMIEATEATIVEVELYRNGFLLPPETKIWFLKELLSLFDTPTDGGVVEYEINVKSPADPLLENNRFSAGVLIRGPRKIVLLNNGGVTSTLAQAIRGQGNDVEICDAKSSIFRSRCSVAHSS